MLNSHTIISKLYKHGNIQSHKE